MFKDFKITNRVAYILGAIGVILICIATVFVSGGMKFGAGYTPVSSYESRTTSYINTSAATIPVASVKDRNGRTIQTSEISSSSTVRIYFTLEPGSKSREEIVFCTGISGNSWTGCARGLDWQGGTNTASSTLASNHNAGSKIIMSDVGQFFSEYVSVVGTQTIYSVKSFDSYPAVTSSAVLPVSAAQFATKAYADSLTISGAAPSTTRGMALDSDSTLYVKVSSTASDNGGLINIVTSTNANGELFFDVLSFLARVWTVTANWIFSGDTTFSGDVTISGNSTISGNATTTGTLTANTPTSSRDVANKGYVDQNLPVAYGDGSDGASSTSAGTMSLNRDYYFTTYTVAIGTTIVTNGYRIFATESITNNGTIHNNGNNGTSAANSTGVGTITGGAGGTTSTAGTLPANKGGGKGGDGSVASNGGAGSPGNSTIRAVGALTSAAGGSGGTAPAGSPGAVGAAGTNSGTALNIPRNVVSATMLFDTSGVEVLILPTSPGSGGGSGGAAVQAQEGGAGGGGGASGGYLFLASPIITNTGTISADGGAGGAGGNGYSASNNAGGGGGGAGSGGVVILIYGEKTDSGTITAAAGAVGAGGTGYGSATNGSDGAAGTAGKVIHITLNP